MLMLMFFNYSLDEIGNRINVLPRLTCCRINEFTTENHSNFYPLLSRVVYGKGSLFFAIDKPTILSIEVRLKTK